jgi:hypothetical protein
MTKLERIKKVKTYDDLESLKIGRIIMDINPRGGYLGFYGDDVGAKYEIGVELLPYKYGAYCNYLGGGVRGKIVASDFSRNIPSEKAEILKVLGEACIRVYKKLEASTLGNSDPYDSLATEAARESGIVSAY